MALTQYQSPLFQLPRELRDEIYAYYTYDERGCLYDHASGRLRTASGRELHLMYSCKKIAEEMKSVWIRTNTVIFIPYSAEKNQEDSQRLHSRAARFEYLLNYVLLTKLLMLHYAAGCVTGEILDDVVRMYPSIDPTFRSSFRAIRRAKDLQWISKSPHEYRDVFSASFCNALQSTLELASSHPDFEASISKACNSAQDYPWYRPPFVEGSHRKIISWKPFMWSIHSDEELSSIERLLVEPHASDGLGYTREFCGIKWYFSATPVCCKVLGRLKPEARKELRSIVLREDCKSVGHPETHAEGLIPFCIENSKVRFLMHAGFSTNLVPSLWALLRFESFAADDMALVSFDKYLYVIIDWLIRTAMLPSCGMPQDSFTVILEAQSEEAVQLWSLLEQVAAVREVLPQNLQDFEATSQTDSGVLMRIFEYLWRLPKALSPVVRDVIAGTSHIIIDGRCGEPWSTADVTLKCRDWTKKDCRNLYRPSSTLIDIPGGLLAYRQKYLADTQQQEIGRSNI